MKILQINGYESPGRRFHGLSITQILKKYGIESKHLVWAKDTQDPEVLTFEGIIPRKINQILQLIENQASLQSILYRNVPKIITMPAFQEADLIHLHIIHSGYFSISDLSMITDLKPTIWTLHDPWAMTGRCIYPMGCLGWRKDCGICPDLNTPFAMKKDNSRFLFNYKRMAYEKANFDIIIASKWMKDMVYSSPMFNDKEIKIYHLPFGVDLEFFSSNFTVSARKRFNISEDKIVISFRSEDTHFKGYQYIMEALEKLETTKSICLLTVGRHNTLERFRGKFDIIELGWTNDDILLRDVLSACDIFLMPSVAEAFGVMAIEAMACSKPVIVFDGDNSLPDVTFAPDVGIAVPMRDSHALSNAIKHLIDNPKERLDRGNKGREIAELHYSQDLHIKNLVSIYKETLNK
ncbi:glycosyltransferase family 4 protein [Rickettsia typhi]|uniref:Glycosyltransferase n=2 Tax=Rickettsia typhi TaxID=785 RepID=A0ABM5MVW4_RICTP|nr:glycosyltransferase family 4 protein [Rickettsia typhi]AAU03806.1 probable glycosyltransferase [Rickettsia typhi str. Wilmington]AFE54183.1 glycosyltransferase [Rickettsia typhi str. TH1527]AFE55023.1 glycosyltransferase [Rickettsia typhi str. B9991CWPP]